MPSLETYRGEKETGTEKPHQAFVDLEQLGMIRGKVLDIGCCSGENALYLASRGYTVTGIDSSPTLIARALLKASRRKLKVKFLLFDSLKVEYLGVTFDTVIDCGLFHSFSQDIRPLYLNSLRSVLKPGGIFHLLCPGEEHHGTAQSHSVTQEDLRRVFGEGWELKKIKKIELKTGEGTGRSPWLLASVVRVPGASDPGCP